MGLSHDAFPLFAYCTLITSLEHCYERRAVDEVHVCCQTECGMFTVTLDCLSCFGLLPTCYASAILSSSCLGQRDRKGEWRQGGLGYAISAGKYTTTLVVTLTKMSLARVSVFGIFPSKAKEGGGDNMLYCDGSLHYLLYQVLISFKLLTTLAVALKQLYT
jgi:hypothetical protein